MEQLKTPIRSIGMCGLPMSCFAGLCTVYHWQTSHVYGFVSMHVQLFRVLQPNSRAYSHQNLESPVALPDYPPVSGRAFSGYRPSAKKEMLSVFC